MGPASANGGGNGRRALKSVSESCRLALKPFLIFAVIAIPAIITINTYLWDAPKPITYGAALLKQ